MATGRRKLLCTPAGLLAAFGNSLLAGDSPRPFAAALRQTQTVRTRLWMYGTCEDFTCFPSVPGEPRMAPPEAVAQFDVPVLTLRHPRIAKSHISYYLPSTIAPTLLPCGHSNVQVWPLTAGQNVVTDGTLLTIWKLAVAWDCGDNEQFRVACSHIGKWRDE